MKRIAALLIAFLLLFICGITIFAFEVVDLVPTGPDGEPLKTFPTYDIWDENIVIEPYETQFYVNLDNRNWENIELHANGMVSACLVNYDPETMVDYMGDDKENKFVTYKVWDSARETDVATGISYFDAKEIAGQSEKYSVVAENPVNIIEINLEHNYSDAYKEGTLKIKADLAGKPYSSEISFISDVIIKDFSETENIAETLNSVPESTKEIKGAYVDIAFDSVIANVVGAKTYSKSGSVPDGMSLSGSWAYKSKFGDYVFKMVLEGTPTKAGTYNFSVSYKKEDGKTLVSKVDYTITVGEKAPFDYIGSIFLDKWPDKTVYYLGDEVDLTGMKVTAVAFTYNKNLEAYEPSEIDITDYCWAEPEIFTSDEAQRVSVYAKLPGDHNGKLKLFEDSFRVTFKYKDVEPEDVPVTNEYIELNAMQDFGYSSYYCDIYGGIGESTYEGATVISTEGFASAKGGKAVINGIDNCFTITIPKISSNQRGINFRYDYSLNLGENKSYEGHPSIKFYSDAVVQSEYIFEWDLGIDAYELRELFGKKVEEDDVVEYYVINGEEKCVGKFTIDYMSADFTKDVKLKFLVPAGSKLPDYRIAVEVQAGSGDYEIPDVDGDFIATGYCGAESDGTNLRWTLNSSYILAISGTGKMADYNGDDRPWEEYAENIRYIKIEDGVESIGSYAFSDFGNLISVSIPDSVYEIREGAFESCSSLKNVTIPEGVTTIEAFTFYYCTSLETVVLPKTLTHIEEFAFDSCSSLENIDLPSRIVYIGRFVFEDCISLKSIVIPQRVTEIGHGVFSGCSKLSKVVIPKSVSNLSNSIFSGCNLKTAGPIGGGYDIEFGWTESIPANVFAYCGSLESVVIPEGIKSIGSYTFNNCTSLKNVTFGKDLEYINWNCFEGCTSLKSIVLPEKLKEVDNSCFKDCKTLETVKFKGNDVEYLGSSAFSGCIKLKNIVLPDNIYQIGSEAFYNCISLEKINMPKNLNSVEHKAFYNCYNLGDIEFFVGLEYIGAGAFDFCDEVKNVYFYGNAPRVTAAGSESQSFDPNTVTLNYIVGKEGWETDANKIWNGYKTEIWRSDFILGDVNLDEKIDVKDVYYVRLAAAKLIELNAEQKLSADVNGDGKINAIDANIIRKFALQIIDRFPIEA